MNCSTHKRHHGSHQCYTDTLIISSSICHMEVFNYLCQGSINLLSPTLLHPHNSVASLKIALDWPLIDLLLSPSDENGSVFLPPGVPDVSLDSLAAILLVLHNEIFTDMVLQRQDVLGWNGTNEACRVKTARRTDQYWTHQQLSLSKKKKSFKRPFTV